VEPLPASLQVIRQLEQSTGEDLLTPLTDVAAALATVVPSCLGFSMSYVRQGIAITFYAVDDVVAALDAVQYASGGPCVDAIDNGETLRTDDLSDPLCEITWHLFSRAASAYGVQSTLSYPLHDGDRVVGSINVYAGEPHAFAGQAAAVAELFGTWAHEAVRNADLVWSTRADAERGPQLLQDTTLINQAAELLAERDDIDVGTARDRVDDAAVRAGVRPVEVAEAILAAPDAPA
jgi:GAF domain-containing protein